MRVLAPGVPCGVTADSQQSGLLVDARDYYRAFFHAARKARSYVAIAGWQFDSNVALLRGEDSKEADGDEIRLLPFLNQLCEKTPDLHIYLLAWDFSVVYAVEREWLQKWVFQWRAHERVHFQFDTAHAMGASHHQKMVIVDGTLAFAGGMDLAASRWDDRGHLLEDARRKERLFPHGPYHDVQAMVRGPAAQKLAEIFNERWCSASGCTFELPPPEPVDAHPTVSLPLPPGKVTLSQTRGCTLTPAREAICEIQTLYERAIDSAEELLYFENQYFTSRAIHDALVKRMRARDRSKLDVVIVLPVRPEALKEQATLGVFQARLLKSLQDEARTHGHALGIYSSVQHTPGGEAVGTYIHSKVLIVDDRFLTMGSANTTNRSLTLDTELNLSWECGARWPFRSPLRRCLQDVRTSLVAEHAGVPQAERETLRKRRGLTKVLDTLVREGRGRLVHHAPESLFDKNPLLKPLEPQAPLFDPELPLEAEVFEALNAGEETYFTRGVQLLSEWLSPAAPSAPPASSEPRGAA